MPGRRDWGALTSQALTDRRFRILAQRLREDPALLAELALVTARGLAPHLGLWAVRETDDGILPDDGVEAIQYATGLPTNTAEKVVQLLQEPAVGLLRPVAGGLYLAGFLDTYEPLVRARAQAKARVAKARGKGPPDPQQPLPGMGEDGHADGMDDNGTGVAEDGYANRSRNNVPVTGAEVTGTDPSGNGNRYANDSRTRIGRDGRDVRIGESPPTPPTTEGGTSTAGGVASQEEGGTGPTAAPGGRGIPSSTLPSLDPRAPLPDAVRHALAAGGGAVSPPTGPGAEPPPAVEVADAFVAAVQRDLEGRRRPWALTAYPAPLLPACLAQIELLRRGGATPAEVADALARSNPASLPSGVFAELRRKLERSPRRTPR